MTIVGDIRVRAHDEYIDDLAKHGVEFDWGNSTPTCHEISLGLNLPTLIGATLVVGTMATLAGGSVQPFLDWDHSVLIQILSGALVPFLWFAIVGFACTTSERLNCSASRAKIVKVVGALFTALTVWASLWLWWHNRSDDWLLRTTPVCWALFGVFSLIATMLRPTAASARA
jgi:hypothetical protein